MSHAEGEHALTAILAAQAEAPLARAGTWRRMLLARWLRGEAARAEGHERLAQILLDSTLKDSESQALPQVAERCHTSLGLLAASRGETEKAEASFRHAVALIETLRAPLPAEEFRTAFVADKLAPYDQLVRLCLEDPAGARVVEALCYVERARSRALVEMMSGTLNLHPRPRDEFEAELFAQLDRLREELNWFYSRINRPPDDAGRDARGRDAMRALHDAVRERESRTLESCASSSSAAAAARTAARRRSAPPGRSMSARCKHELGHDTALIEYTSLEGELLAFVVTHERVEVVRGLSSEREVGEAVGQFRFQTDALRHGSARMREHLPMLAERARRHLSTLYDLLLRRVEPLAGERRLVVVPHRALHYVPFHALHDGESYVVERREVSYAPSAGVLRHCLGKPRTAFESALLMGVADSQTPRVRDEIESLAPLFNKSEALLDEHATIAALREGAARSDVLPSLATGSSGPTARSFLP